MALKIYETIPVGPLACNCYIVGDPDTRQGIVIDPGGDAELILGAIERHGLQITATLSTHAHFDHVLAADAVREATGVPYYLHAADVPLLNDMQQRGLLYGLKLPSPPQLDRTYAEGDRIAAGALVLEVLETPGHTMGSVSLVAPGEAVFAGDTLFLGSIGRTDLVGGDFDSEIKSIRDKLFTLEDMPVLPGHGPATTIGREKATNPFVGTNS